MKVVEREMLNFIVNKVIKSTLDQRFKLFLVVWRLPFIVAIAFFVSTNPSYSQNLSIDEAWALKEENPKKAIDALNTSLAAFKKSGNLKMEAKALSYIGTIEDIQGNSVEAIDYLLKAIRIQEKNNYLKDLSFSYNNIGIAHFYQFNYETALMYYKKSLAIDKTRKDLKGEAGALINIGLIYTYIDSFPNAIKNYQDALKIYTQLNDSLGLASTLNNLAKIEMSDKDYQTAIGYYNQALTYLETTNSIEAKFTPYYGLANAHLQLNETSKAVGYALEAVDLAKRANARERLQYGYEILSEAYEKFGNLELAYANLRNYADLRDSLINEDRTSRITEMQTKYESEKKDKHIVEIELKNQQEKSLRIQRENEALEKEKVLNFVLVTLFSILIILSIVVYAYRIKQRNNRLLNERNTAIQDNLNQKETMIGEIHHRVKNNLQLITSILDLQARSLEDKEAIKAINDSQNRVQTMAIIHQKLYQQDSIYGISMREYIASVSEAIVNSSLDRTKKIDFKFNIDEIQLHIDSTIPIGLIITEIITNAIKYAFPDVESGTISITLSERDNSLYLSICDNGVGMENAATSSNSTSFGLKMIKSLARQLKAEWNVTVENGTKFEFTITKYKRSEESQN